MRILLALLLGPRACTTCRARTRRHLWRDAQGQCMTCAYGKYIDLWAPLS